MLDFAREIGCVRVLESEVARIVVFVGGAAQFSIGTCAQLVDGALGNNVFVAAAVARRFKCEIGCIEGAEHGVCGAERVGCRSEQGFNFGRTDVCLLPFQLIKQVSVRL